MEPKYSILLCNQKLTLYENHITAWLTSGIKVLWFGKKEEVEKLKESFRPFSDAFLLQAYEIGHAVSGVFVDGQDMDGLIDYLEEACPVFNAAQYRVEHCQAEKHIVVQASAGTGKTKVMVDRTMFLMHTVPDLDMSEIFMITFTNDATDQMNKRLQDALVTRYRLTKNKRYLEWLEQQSRMNISTIHSFAYSMLKEYGIGESFTQNLQIRSFSYEKKQLVKDIIDSRTDTGVSVISQLGVPFYRASDIVKDFWDGITRLGVSHRDLARLDWGRPANPESEKFHRIISDIICRLDEQYFEVKRENNAVDLDDIMRDLQEILLDENLPKPDLSMKFLFIDEFQDSDLSQIRVACLLARILGSILFVVGDIKQSIYRFRGATDQAFSVFARDMKEMGLPKAQLFTLVNNYRTAAGVLRKLDRYFRAWNEIGRLQYKKAVIPFHQKDGRFEVISGVRKEDTPDQIAELVSKELARLVKEVKTDGRIPMEKDRVVILTRTNNQLNDLAMLLRIAKIPASIRQDGSFYASEAVRDFYLMVSSFLFSDEPKHVFNYLMTPYAGSIESLDIHRMELLHGDYDSLVEYLDHFLDQTSWKHYHKELRLRPVMAVFKDMIDNGFIMDHYIANAKTRKRANGWPEERCIADTRTKAVQYRADLEKLMELLQRNLTGDKVSLYDIYRFLKLKIATDRTESQAEVQVSDDYRSVLCMTVHKAKGLEFDTVIIPYTKWKLPEWEQTEVIVDPIEHRIGWNYDGDEARKNKKHKYRPMRNTMYAELQEKNYEAGLQEECRILYVAMTRAINTLICIEQDTNSDANWAYLLDAGGVQND